MSPTEHEQIMDDYNAAQRLMKMHRYDDAARYLRNCFVRCEKAGDHTSCETLLGELAACLEKAGRYGDSVGVLSDLLRLVASHGLTRRLAIVHHNLGFLYEQQQDLAAAEREFAHSSHIAAEIGDLRGQGMSTAMRGQLLVSIGQVEDGFGYLLQAATLLQESDAPELEHMINHILDMARRLNYDGLAALARRHIRQGDLLRILLDS
jgi:tetratricopeptide (TPR) repeat protein